MLLDWAMGLFSADLGVDLGTANAQIAVRGRGVVVCEPSIVAVRTESREVLLRGRAVGSVAKAMVARTPPGIETVWPMRAGRIADFELAEALLSYLMQKAHDRRIGVRPRVLIAVPSGLTPVEKRAVFSSAERAGARRVQLIHEPYAAALGCGLPIRDAVGSMVCDVGGGTTEIAVLSLGCVVRATSIEIGGDDFDRAVTEFLKLRHRLHIGASTAEIVKRSLGSLAALAEELDMDVCGRDTVTGLPRMVTVCSEEIREALTPVALLIARAIRDVLEQTNPELCGDLVERGLTLCGGSAELMGLDALLTQETGIPVEVADDPAAAVARGTSYVLDDLSAHAAVLETEFDLF